MPITELARPPAHEVAKKLRDYAELAERGEVVGCLLIVTLGGGDSTFDFAGEVRGGDAMLAFETWKHAYMCDEMVRAETSKKIAFVPLMGDEDPSDKPMR